MNARTATDLEPRVAERVADFLRTLDASPVAADVLGVVVGGSAARREEMWRDGELLSDIDLMVLTRRTSPRLIAGIEEVVARHRHAGIDGGQTPLGPLARYLTLTYFEARATGVVVRGEVDLARLIPPVSAADLPLWEGVRVLANRLLEHVKHDQGLLPADRVVAKSYEALAEAHLVAEGRYRPTYRQRLAELEHRPPAAPPSVVERMTAVLRTRLDSVPPASRSPGDLDAQVSRARADLVEGLAAVAARHTATPGDAAVQLRLLGRRLRHSRHRLYWAALMARDRRWADLPLRTDPIITVWQRALALLTGPAIPPERHQLLEDWRRCPQILTRRP